MCAVYQGGMFISSDSSVGNVDPNRRGEKNVHCGRISSADKMAAQQTGWKESEESAAENQEQGKQ